MTHSLSIQYFIKINFDLFKEKYRGRNISIVYVRDSMTAWIIGVGEEKGWEVIFPNFENYYD